MLGRITIGLTRINKDQKVTVTLRDATVGTVNVATTVAETEFEFMVGTQVTTASRTRWR